MNVTEYYQERHNLRLMGHALPCVDVGKRGRPTYIPIELCSILPMQPFKGKLAPDQVSSQITFTCLFPPQRREKTQEANIVGKREGDTWRAVSCSAMAEERGRRHEGGSSVVDINGENWREMCDQRSEDRGEVGGGCIEENGGRSCCQPTRGRPTANGGVAREENGGRSCCQSTRGKPTANGGVAPFLPQRSGVPRRQPFADVDPLRYVRETTQWVVDRSRHVSIDDNALVAVAEQLAGSWKQVQWNWEDIHFQDAGALTVQYIFVVDVLNFCFWPDPDLTYEHLAQSLKMAVLRDPHALDAERPAACDVKT
ncbi:hypothetical protein CBR_g29716 [Chara braunii]|uniref:Queuosine 5'-phosphate N-glycosylase/hydrolase n=1 Tax=Chara braunii TaxID=69332 RepID=A0A388LB79_CHABU|nr:hypothetical protein CBR_g29716 [Chara braunii]|eukprot:GBG79569.1 hypothetical protein CBR_g29716 [Chara braunii]